MSGPSSQRLASIRALAHAELQTTARPPRHWRAAAGLVLAELVAAAAGVVSGRAGWIGNRAPAAQLWALAALLLAVVTWSALTALLPGRRSAAGWALAAAGALVLVVVGGSGLSVGHALVPGALSCGRFELAIALLPAIVALVFLTRFAPHPWRALQAGFSAAAAGLLALHLHCPDGTPAHLVLGHLLPALVVSVAVLWVRPWLPSRSYVP